MQEGPLKGHLQKLELSSYDMNVLLKLKESGVAVEKVFDDPRLLEDFKRSRGREVEEQPVEEGQDLRESKNELMMREPSPEELEPEEEQVREGRAPSNVYQPESEDK